jgi:phage major head subunit gpT-like protein
MKITPNFVMTFEKNLQTLVLNSWDRVVKNLIWDQVMDVKTSATGSELYFWLLETAKIYDEGAGGTKRFDDLAATYFEIVNSNSGAGLKLTKNEIEDNQMANKMPALIYSANWASQIGSAGAYWPQDQMFSLIANGKTTLGYDGVNFFSASHPINPVTGAAAGTYSNLITAKPLATAADVDTAAKNLTSVMASMRSFKMANGKYRMLRPKALLHDPSNLRAVSQILQSSFFNASDNVLTNLGVKPICADELSVEPGVWYLVAEMLPGEGGPFIYQNRSSYELTTYAPATQVELNRTKVFEWHFDGRNAASYGHPYLIIRVEPT